MVVGGVVKFPISRHKTKIKLTNNGLLAAYLAKHYITWNIQINNTEILNINEREVLYIIRHGTKREFKLKGSLKSSFKQFFSTKKIIYTFEFHFP